MVNRGVLTKVCCPRCVRRDTEPWKADCGGRGFIPRATELTIIVRFSYSLCRGRNYSTYPIWTWSGNLDYPGKAMQGYRSKRFSLSSSVCYGIGEDREVPVRGVLRTAYDLRS